MTYLLVMTFITAKYIPEVIQHCRGVMVSQNSSSASSENEAVKWKID